MPKQLPISALTALIVVGCSVGNFGSIAANATDEPKSSNQRDQCAGSNDRRWSPTDGRSSTLNVVGLTRDQRLICFNERRPEKVTNIGTVSGLSGGDTALIGIDYRVQNGMLYGVGNAGGIYLLNTTNATATLVNRLTVGLSGTAFGVDFNPVADRLRIVSDTGQNLRHNVNPDGVTIADTALNYTAGVTALGVVGAAYTNNDLDPTTNTTLYNLDSTLDQIVVQSPPNNGSLVANGKLTVDATAIVGFDTYSTLRNGVTVEVQSLAAIKTADGATKLYAINVTTGKAIARGTFSDQQAVIDIAIPLNQR
jgi:Domain of unknown function (DUF4394)